jgi:hypothetical protein
MALTSTITARLTPSIGLVGQSVGFVDFTPTELASNGYISTLSRTYEIDCKTILAAIVSPTLGKEALMTEISTVVDAYLATVFTDAAVTYAAKIYVLNVTRTSEAIAGVSAADIYSTYVDRDDQFNVSVRINVSVV